MISSGGNGHTRSIVPSRRRTLRSREEPAPDSKSLLVDIGDVRPGQSLRVPDGAEGAEGIERLAESMRSVGILTPLIVRETGRQGGGRRVFEVMAGNRRLAAADLAGLRRLPVRVLPADDRDTLLHQLADDLSRQSLSDMELLAGVSMLVSTFGMGVREIARSLGCAPGWISEILLVASSHEERLGVDEGRLGMVAAAKLARLRDHPEARHRLLERLRRGETLRTEDIPTVRSLAGRSAAEPALPAPAPSDEVVDAEFSSVPGSAAGTNLSSAEPAPLPPAPVPAGVPLLVNEQGWELLRWARARVREVAQYLHTEANEQGRDHPLPPAFLRQLELLAADVERARRREPPDNATAMLPPRRPEPVSLRP